jgi:hypothetical protein
VLRPLQLTGFADEPATGRCARRTEIDALPACARAREASGPVGAAAGPSAGLPMTRGHGVASATSRHRP